MARKRSKPSIRKLPRTIRSINFGRGPRCRLSVDCASRVGQTENRKPTTRAALCIQSFAQILLFHQLNEEHLVLAGSQRRRLFHAADAAANVFLALFFAL